jgi:predicted nucleotidyltransferase
MSKTNFDKEIGQIIKTIKSCFDELHLSAYLIGAQARDIWFLPTKVPRITHDIDWVIAQSNEDIFNELKNILIDRYGFVATNNPLRLIAPHNIEVDLLPFDHPDIPSFLGLHEIFERGTEMIAFDKNEYYQIATLPAIVLLKFIAWHNNPEKRRKDIEDIAYIFQHYDIYTDECFELFTEIDPSLISARAIGRKINYIIGNSTALKNHITQIITVQIENPMRSKFIHIMNAITEKSEKDIINQLSQLLIGISEETIE